jgi:hypothetical protein
MNFRVIDLDGSMDRQQEVLSRYRPSMASLRNWGPGIRMACSFARFRRFENALAAQCDSAADAPGTVTCYGSGDYHHVTLALLRRQPQPFNLLVLDNHPDWVRGVPFLHCGTWLAHACRLPWLYRVFHVGGDVDFDNHYRWMAPWSWLRNGKITVFPASRRFARGSWAAIANRPLRERRSQLLCADRLEELIRPIRSDLASRPLYVSLDKDVLKETEAVVNWDSGHLVLSEVQTLLTGFIRAAKGDLVGMDIVGDWSEVRMSGLLRRTLHLMEHPSSAVVASEAARCNERTNLRIIETLRAAS